MNQVYTWNGEVIDDIDQWVKDNNDVMLRIKHKQYQPMTQSWHKWEERTPKSWYECMRFDSSAIPYDVRIEQEKGEGDK